PAPQPVPAAIAKSKPPVAPPPVLSKTNTPSADDVPPGVFRPREMAALKLVAEGKDPAHPDTRAVVQGKVISAGPSSTGKVFHIHFAGVGGTDAFDAAYFQSNGMFEKMEARFGKDVPAALVGKTIRISGKVRLYHDGPELVLDSPDQVTI